MKNDPAGERILRAKYLDWCSAKIADRFLELTPDQIYELAHWRSGIEVVGEGSPPSRGDPSLQISVEPKEPIPQIAAGNRISQAAQSHPGDPAAAGGAVYLAMVERVAEALARTLALPPFEEWAIAYQDSPERFDAELIGLWQVRPVEPDDGQDMGLTKTPPMIDPEE